jgi:beta-glucosidase
MYLGPALDIMRSPKAGRNWERCVSYGCFSIEIKPNCSYSFGADPYLAGEAAYETIEGVQSVGVMACAKHFLANNQEHWRYGLSADIDDRTTQELYLYAYYRAVEVSLPISCHWDDDQN